MKLVTVIVLIMVARAMASTEKGESIENAESFIVDGENTPNVRFYAYLEIFRQSNFEGLMYFGGGVYIQTNIILTVAQNVEGFQSWRIGLGANRISDMQWFYATRFFVHPGYNNVTLADNIALIRPNQILPTNDYIGHILRVISPITTPVEGRILEMVGFGFGNTNNQPKELQRTDMSVINQEECEIYYPHLVTNQITANIFCGNIRQGNMCAGDQGGPVYDANSNFLLGLQSFNRIDDCTVPESHPPVFVRMAPYSGWIDETRHLENW